MLHTESVRPSSCASCGRAGRRLPTIVEVMTGVVSLPNGCLPVKTLDNVQISDEPSIPLPPTLGGGKDKPLLQPFQKQIRLLPVWLYLLPRESPVRPMQQCIYWPALRSSFHGRSRPARDSSNERDCCDRREYWTSSRGLSTRPKTARRKCLPLSSFHVWCDFCEDTKGLRLHPTAWEDHVIGEVRLQGGGLTRLIRFAPGFFSMNSNRVPLGIHSETICKGFFVTPMKGTMFGCLSLFRITASLKNDYKAHRCS